MAARLTALVIGSISRDLCGDGTVAAGGVVHWAGLALLRLGARVRVLTRAAARDDALLDPLRARGAEVLRLLGSATTTCLNAYAPRGDRHELLARSEPIGAADVPERWRAADLVQLGPLHRRDLAPDVARGLGGLIGLDVQGLVRSGRGARTRLAAARGLAPRLAGVAVLKAGESELPFVLRRGEPEALLVDGGPQELLVTRGARGALLITREGRAEVPALPVLPRHLVGAGDVFLAAFLYARARGAAPLRAARLASRASAAKIEAGELPEGFALEENET